MRILSLNRLIMSVILLFTAFFSSISLSETESSVTESTITPVKILAISDLFDEEFDTFLARIDATSRAQLSFQVKGEVKTLSVRMGQSVKQGQLLATLDPKDLQLALDAANAEYLLVKAQWERSKLLFKKKLVSADDYDQLETQHKTALAKYQRAKTDLDYTKIRAPFDGVISYTYVKPYQFVQSKQKILNLINNEQLDVLVTLPVSYVEAATLNSLDDMTLWLTMDSDPSNRIKGVFKEISTKPNEDTNSYEAIVSINRPKEKNFLTGMTGLLHIAKTKNANAIVLPNTAWISKSANQGEVWLMDPDTNKVRKASLSLNAKGEVETGLSKEDLVVIAGVEKLSENQEVKAWVREEGI